MAKRIEYKLALREGYPPETRLGHLFVVSSEGSQPVKLALCKVSGGWAVDHPASGRSVTVLDVIVGHGRGPNLAQCKQEIEEQFERQGLGAAFAAVSGTYQILNPEFT